MEIVWRLSALALRILHDSTCGSEQEGARLCVLPADQHTLAALGPTHYRLARALNAMERRQFLEAASKGARLQQEWASMADDLVKEYR